MAKTAKDLQKIVKNLVKSSACIGLRVNLGTTKLDEERSHCILCNNVINNNCTHAFCDEEHEKRLNLSLVDDDGKRKEDFLYTDTTIETIQAEATGKDDSSVPELESKLDNNQYVKSAPNNLCDVCFTPIDSSADKTHGESPQHKSNIALGTYLLVYISNINSLKCKVCLSTFPVDQMKEHLISDIHQNSYRRLLLTNSMTRTKFSVFCCVCLEAISIGDEMAHVATTKHLIVTADPSSRSIVDIEQTNESIPINERHYCEVCSIYISGGAHNVTSHNNGARHKRNQSKAEESGLKQGALVAACSAQEEAARITEILQQYSHQIQVNAKLTQAKCKVCSKVLPLTSSRVSEHLDSYAHKRNISSLAANGLKLRGNFYWCRRCDVHVPLTEQFHHIVDPQHLSLAGKPLKGKKLNQNGDNQCLADSFQLYALLPTSDKSQLFCRVCGVAMPDAASSLCIHINGRNHRSNMADMLAKNLIKQANGIFKCQACQHHVPKEDLFYHIDRAIHVTNVQHSESVVVESSPETQNEQAQEVEEPPSKSKKKKSKAASSSKDEGASKTERNDESTVISTEKCKKAATKAEDVNKNIISNDDDYLTLGYNMIRVEGDVCYCDSCIKSFSIDALHLHLVELHHVMLVYNSIVDSDESNQPDV